MLSGGSPAAVSPWTARAGAYPEYEACNSALSRC